MTFRPLREHPHVTLIALGDLVTELLVHSDAIPPDLYIKLDTYHADIAAAIEDTAPAPRLHPVKM